MLFPVLSLLVVLSLVSLSLLLLLQLSLLSALLRMLPLIIPLLSNLWLTLLPILSLLPVLMLRTGVSRCIALLPILARPCIMLLLILWNAFEVNLSLPLFLIPLYMNFPAGRLILAQVVQLLLPRSLFKLLNIIIMIALHMVGFVIAS